MWIYIVRNDKMKMFNQSVFAHVIMAIGHFKVVTQRTVVALCSDGQTDV